MHETCNVKVYFISGLAADRRIFKYIRLPEGFEAYYLDFIPHLEGETLRDYALRLAENIYKEEPFVLVGVSFGGMLAVEIAKKHPPQATIIIGSIPVSSHLPNYFKIAAALNLHRIVPMFIIKASAITKRLFTNSREDQRLLTQVIKESDPALMRWSMHAVLHWDNDEVPRPLWHIHGTRDEVLPMRYTSPTHTIPRAGHLLVINRHKEVNTIIQKLLHNVAQ